MTILSADVGGTKVAVALVTLDGTILAKTQQLTSQDGPGAVVEQIASMGAQMAGGHALQVAGVCVPAALAARDTDRVLWAPNLAGWRDIPLREMLQDRLGLPTFLEFDGHATAFGEWWAGAGKGCQSLASIIIGTGIGGGFVVDGRIWSGRDRLAGAVGWLPLSGPQGTDHWENLAAGPAIARRARQLLDEGQESVLSGEVVARAVFDAARQGDSLAAQVVREAAEVIGRGVAGVISLANPEIVVLGGSIGQQGDLLLETVHAAVQRWAQPISAKKIPIVSSTLGEEAGLLGAAYAAYQRLHSQRG
jgi:glucokinase